MRFLQVALLGLSAHLVQGAEIPKDAEDGFYTFIDDGNGGYTPKLLALHVDSDGDFMSRRVVAARDDCPTTPFFQGEVGVSLVVTYIKHSIY